MYIVFHKERRSNLGIFFFFFEINIRIRLNLGNRGHRVPSRSGRFTWAVGFLPFFSVNTRVQDQSLWRGYG